MDIFVAFPVCAGGTGFAKDGDQRGDIPGGHEWVDGNFGAAGGDEEMTAAVSPSAGDADAIHNIDDRIKAAGFSPVSGFCEHEPSVFEWGILRGESLAWRLIGDLPPASGSFGGIDDFVECGESTDSGGHPVLEFDADQCAEERDSVNEGFCAIDGVNDPAKAARSGEAGEFFAEDSIIGEVGLDVLSDEEFGIAIGDGDR